MSSVKVAVRVRPFNKREIDLDCSNIIRMVDNKTVIQNPKSSGHDEDAKEFTFDHSYWSFDESDAHFASQSLVFQHLGKEIVSDAIEGYNSCIFAYGQTGSGKTHTMMGDSSSEGLIPRICQWLFQQMSSTEKNSETVSNKTEISYLEIYNEQVRDLLDSNQDINGNFRRPLKVREDPKKGPYVEKLSKHMVCSYEEILELMQKGNANRTTAATSMNDTSSRSHAIFTISFSKASYVANNPYETISKINLVDLAGSERANATNAQGQRLVEGSHINKSLVTLGSVISILAENCKKNNKKKSFIPYRDSILTWLLKDSLGGNSKTVMVATISPADVNYGETLNTLRYANRAKNILNKPHINEDVQTKLIRELRSEIERLNSMINQNPTLTGRIQESEAKVNKLTEEWMNKWDDVKSIFKEQDFIAIRKSGNFGLILDSDRPHLIVCVDDDVLSTGVTLYHLNDGTTSIGTKFADTKQDIVINGGSDVEDEHCTIHWNSKDNVVTLNPINKALCFVNNTLVEGPTVLHQGCLIVFGENMYRFSNPLEVKNLKQKANQDTSFLNRSSHLISSTSYDSMYTSVNSINNKKALMSSFASSHGLNENDEEGIQNATSSSDAETSCLSDKFALVNEELNFIKAFLLELQRVIKCDSEEPTRSLMETFVDIVVQIGKDEHFSKERILTILSFINKLELNDVRGSDEAAIQKVGDFLMAKLNTLKVQVKDEMKLDYMNNNEAASNNSTVDDSTTTTSTTSDSGEQMAESALTESAYGQLCHLASEVDSNMALLSQCVNQLNIANQAASSEINSITSSNSTVTPVTSSQQQQPANGQSLEEIIESEVQRRLELHLQGSTFDSRTTTNSEHSFEATNLNLVPKELMCSTPLLSSTSPREHATKVDRSLSVTYEELDQIEIYIPAFHILYHPDEHYEYEIKIGINGDKWTIFRRYRSFLQLHKFIRAMYGNRINMPLFPRKRLWNNMNEKVIENRRRYLENYLQKVIDQCKVLPQCPLNFRSTGLEHLDRFCLFNFNSFFCLNSLVDQEDFR